VKVASPVLRGRVFCKENLLLEHIHERDLLNKWYEVQAMLPEIIKATMGYDYLEMLLCYTLTKIEQNDKIKLEKMLTSVLDKETGEKIMGSLAHHWQQQGKELGILEGIQIGKTEGIQIGEAKGKIEIAKKMLAQGCDISLIATVTGLDVSYIRSLK